MQLIEKMEFDMGGAARAPDGLPPSLRFRNRQGGHAGRRELDFSPREMQTLYLMLLGRTRKQIAAQLQLSVHTVDIYRRTLLEKVREPNPTCLVRHAVAAGWIRIAGAATAECPARLHNAVVRGQRVHNA